MNILKFSKKNCNPCNAVSHFLDNNGINYSKIDVETTEDFDSILKYNVRNVPLLVILNTDGTEKSRIVGYDAEKLNSLLV